MNYLHNKASLLYMDIISISQQRYMGKLLINSFESFERLNKEQLNKTWNLLTYLKPLAFAYYRICNKNCRKISQ